MNSSKCILDICAGNETESLRKNIMFGVVSRAHIRWRCSCCLGSSSGPTVVWTGSGVERLWSGGTDPQPCDPVAQSLQRSHHTSQPVQTPDDHRNTWWSTLSVMTLLTEEVFLFLISCRTLLFVFKCYGSSFLTHKRKKIMVWSIFYLKLWPNK